MNAWAHRPIGMLLLVTGIIAGSVVAKDAPSQNFKKITLFEAMRQLHEQTGTDIIFATADAQERSFTLPASRAQEAVAKTAQQFGRTAVPLSQIMVLETTLPAAVSPTDRLAAVYDWVGDRMTLAQYTSAVHEEEKRLNRSLPPGTRTFDALTPDQRQDLLSLLRTVDTENRTGHLFQLMQDWERAHPRRS